VERIVVVGWSWTQHAATRARYEAAIADPRHAHLAVHRLSTPAQVRAFLDSVPAQRRPPQAG
jgi:hypothetical protein